MKDNLPRSGISLKSAPAGSLAALVASATAAPCSVVKAKTRKGLCPAAGLLAALVLFSLQPHTWATDMGPLTNIDGISFEAGNLQEVGGHAVSGRGPAELEGEEPFVRFPVDGGYVDFELTVDPGDQNYLTVKVWGGSGADAERPGSTLLLRDPDTGDAPFTHVGYGPVPRHHPRRGEISRQHMAAPFPGRFFYVTYPIPRAMTDGNSSVQLRLLYKGPEPGLDVYNVYMMPITAVAECSWLTWPS